MALVSYIAVSAGRLDLGHMMLGSELSGRVTIMLGFRFRAQDIPKDCRTPLGIRRYLVGHAMPGVVVDETAYLKALRRRAVRRMRVIRRGTGCYAEEIRAWRVATEGAGYTLSPDRHDRPGLPCYNCVKWAVRGGRHILPRAYPEIRQWRIRDALPHSRPLTL